jgi:aryl-alcohol dehydrogenase-like predicted oxidoreductase
MQVALAWLLQRSPNILVILGTSSIEHLRENVQSSMLRIPAEVIAISMQSAEMPRMAGTHRKHAQDQP